MCIHLRTLTCTSVYTHHVCVSVSECVYVCVCVCVYVCMFNAHTLHIHVHIYITYRGKAPASFYTRSLAAARRPAAAAAGRGMSSDALAAEEQALREDISVAHWLTRHYGMDELQWNHISAKMSDGASIITPGEASSCSVQLVYSQPIRSEAERGQRPNLAGEASSCGVYFSRMHRGV